jgi:2Fe-2S ferredoxin
MPKVRFIQTDGKEYDVEIPNGLSVMEGAVNNLIDGIEATCGGSCSCATCHVLIDPEWETRVPPKAEMEVMMLESVSEPSPNGRLSCQIQVTPELDGLVVRIPKSQR